jgi:ribosomal protein S18 acetylase RimI-like enzyme/catechol 2,3-dioxygenase-like lactoylglutathione lyase family enzyme
MSLLIRSALSEDLDAVVALLREDVIREVDESDVPAASYREAFEEIRADAHQDLLVGELGGEVVATAQVTWVRHLTYVGGLMCQLESVRVRSDVRGRGIGRSLVEHVVGQARARGAARVELTTNARRERAQAFYRSLGFTASHVGMKLYLGPPAAGSGLSTDPAAGVPMRLHHVQVACPPGGEDEARRFYRDALGIPEVAKPPVLAARGGCWFRGESVEVHVGVEEGFVPARKAHPAFVVDDIDTLAERVGAAGFGVTWDDGFPGYRRFYTADGAGNRVELLASP